MHISCFSSYFHLLISATIDDFYLQQLSLCCLPHGNFLFPLFFLHLLTGILLDGRVVHLTIYLLIQQFIFTSMKSWICLISWAIIHHYHNIFCLLKFPHIWLSAYTNVLLTYSNIFSAVPYSLAHKIFHSSECK